MELKSFNQLVKKVVEVKSKASLWLYTTTQEIDHYCPKGSQPAYTTATKANTPSNSIKDPKVEEHKVRTQEVIIQHTNDAKTSKKARNKKKKSKRNQKKNQKDFIPAIAINTTDAL